MQKKKLDSRIPTLISNNVLTNHRSFFIIIGDQGREQVVTLHYLLSKLKMKRPSVLWCYKKELGFTSHRKKRMNLIKKQVAKGIREIDQENPFELFVSSTDIRYNYYKESDKILGQTFGMLILQDFEALTPNLLAKSIETVQGGGIVILLLKTMNSLKQLYALSMDVHSRTESHQEMVARFNERFILSVGGCSSCLVVDDELNVLPISAGRSVKPIKKEDKEEITPLNQELIELKASLKDINPTGALVACAKTLDQAKAILTFIDSISEKTLRSTVALTAARGRGKSAALGIAIAAAISYGYSNIFLTSPSPENLKTLFEFIFKGFDALGYKEHLDYDIIQSTNPDFQKAIVRVNVFKEHRQTIQWIQPADYHVLAQAELLIIDEAAAIPLPVVKKLIGPYLVFMASTINGYEGTGRALSLKLIQQLRDQSKSSGADSSNGISIGRDGKESKESLSSFGGRTLREVKLEEPIRYGPNDAVEAWLNDLLCLNCCNPDVNKMRTTVGCPHPSMCELYYVNRDTLFSYHPVSETFLQKMMSLYVASHYKNSPNDLQLLSDAPAHHLFVLLPPIDESKATSLPEPLCVVQVCLEGAISKGTALSSLAKGIRSSGDLIPWVVAQQFQDDDFASLSGARVVRIATHPDYNSMGYGSRALQQLEEYFTGKTQTLDEDEPSIAQEIPIVTDEELQESSLLTETVKVRDSSTMPPMLLKLSQRPLKEHLHWLGVSYGLTNQLHKFWKRSGFKPVYLRQTSNDLTGEHTCIMLKALEVPGGDVTVEKGTWLNDFSKDFRRRFLELLAYQFRSFSPMLVLSILDACEDSRSEQKVQSGKLDNSNEVFRHFTPFDLKRLSSYSQNLLDYHVVMDLLGTLANCYFMNNLQRKAELVSESTTVKLSAVQAAIIAGVGLQKKSIDDIQKDLDIPVSQILALMGKSIRKVSLYLNSIVEKGIEKEMDEAHEETKKKIAERKKISDSNPTKDLDDEEAWDPINKSLNEDLDEAGNKAMKNYQDRQREIIGSIDLSRFSIGGTDEDWDNVKINGGSNTVSIMNPDSKKKRKLQKDLAANLASQHSGELTGINDPKGLINRKKTKKKSRK